MEKEKSQDIGEQIISKLQELNKILDEFIKKHKSEKNGWEE